MVLLFQEEKNNDRHITSLLEKADNIEYNPLLPQ